jgi:hypothetical protein
MARYTTYKSGIVSGSNLIAASIATSNVFGTASYVLNVVSASFAKNASGSWLSSSFGTSLSALSAIGFGTDGKPLTVFPAQDSLYLTVVDGTVGWTSLDSAIASSTETDDAFYLNFSDVPTVFDARNNDYMTDGEALVLTSIPNIFDFQTSDFIRDADSFQLLNLVGSSLYTFAMTSYTTSSI